MTKSGIYGLFCPILQTDAFISPAGGKKLSLDFFSRIFFVGTVDRSH